VEQLLAYATAAWALDGGPATLSAGPRGALGQVWRLEVGGAAYALKETFAFDDEPLSAQRVAAEVAFARRASAAGVRLPAIHPDRTGRHLLPHPSGAGWLRLYDWVELRPVDPAAPTAPRRLGELLARLHRCAPPARAEPDGGGPDGGGPDGGGPHPWYDRPPAPDAWPPIVAAADVAGAGWAARLAERVAELPALHALVGPAPAAPATLVLCHRDLHPENVFADPAGELVVVDWDSLGPAAPGREVAALLFDWFFDGGEPDLAAMRGTYAAYRAAGGPGRVAAPADLTMLLATRLNFLRVQVAAALDPRTEPRHREWAQREIDEALRILPGPRLVAEVLDALPA
jgi:Ser/Thr protein kinase RdoA (MazF antagonist)